MERTDRHSVIFILIEGGQLVLEKRTEPDDKYLGFTIIPGGGVEDGETVHQALEREVGEEFGVRATRYCPIGIVETGFQGGLHIRHVFVVERWEGELSNPEGRNEHLRLSFEDTREVCTHPISQRVLDLWEDYQTRGDR